MTIDEAVETLHKRKRALSKLCLCEPCELCEDIPCEHTQDCAACVEDVAIDTLLAEWEQAQEAMQRMLIAIDTLLGEQEQAQETMQKMLVSAGKDVDAQVQRAEARLMDALHDHANTLQMISFKPCPKCGAGVIADCYGCRLQAVEAENTKLHKNIDLLLADLEAAGARLREAQANKEALREEALRRMGVIKDLQARLREAQSGRATAEALVMSHEGHIAKLEARLREVVEWALQATIDRRDHVG
jgi:hypothetical protein